MTRSHEELKDLLVPYALGAVPEDEMAEIRAHILTCEECMAEADSFTEAASSLAFAADEEPLPAGFAERVLDRAREGRVSAPAPAPLRARRWRLIEGLSFAALIVAVVALTFNVVDARSDLAYERKVVSALVASDQGLKLSGSEGAAATVVSSGGAALFVAQGLEGVPSDRTYQLWLMDGECAPPAGGDCTVTSAGTFETRDGIALLETSRQLEGVDAAAVTIEPEGGSDAPTSEPLLSSF